MQLLTPYQWHKVDVANAFGLDKDVWDKRLEWFDLNEGRLESLVDEADDKWAYIKAVSAIRDVQAGKPTGHPIGLDATASGLGIIACLTGCIKTASNVNLVRTGKREDPYTKVSEEIYAVHKLRLARSLIKYPIMTVFYNSTAKPKEILGEGKELEAFYDILERELPGGVEYLTDVQSCWNPEALEYIWTLPDGHKAVVKVMDAIDSKVEIDELDGVSFTYRRKVNKAIEYGLSLQANIVQSVDGYVVREMKRRCRNSGFNICTIFDDFRCLARYVNKMRQHYIDIMAEIAESDLLSSILSEILGFEIEYEKKSDNLADLIRDAEYPLS